MPTVGIVIPARNEEACLPHCLHSLQPFLQQGDTLLVVDAQSTDATARIAASGGATTLRSPYNERGYSLAYGTQWLLNHTSPELLIFAHADMIFHPDTRSHLLTRMENHPDCAGGCLGHRIENPHPVYRLIERGNTLRARVLGLSYGDQAQVVRTRWLQEQGGFPWLPRLEDLELALRMRSTHQYVNHPVTIPSRHWNRGILHCTLRNWGITLNYLLSRRWKRAETLPTAPTFSFTDHDLTS